MGLEFKKVKKPPSIQYEDWNNWKWQLRNALKTKQDFQNYFSLTKEEEEGFLDSRFSVQCTPYYACLLNWGVKEKHPMRCVVIPDKKEHISGVQSLLDPLGEVRHSPCHHLIHRYPDRVVFLVTDTCPIYCRYCTRKRFTAKTGTIIKKEEYQKALNYIRENKGIREVILSGGDPLTLGDVILGKILSDLRAIPHVEIIRIGSRVLGVCPMRITRELVDLLKLHQPVFIMSHFIHPLELTEEVAIALTTCADGGVPVYNQMVLLNGVNNHPALIQALSRRLLYLRARPYYMFQCDPSKGTDHFRTSISNSLAIQKELWGKLSGLATPRLSVDLPDGGGKVELVPKSSRLKNSFFEKKGVHAKEHCYFKGWDGEEAVYKEPACINSPKPIEPYYTEWKGICSQNYGKNKQ